MSEIFAELKLELGKHRAKFESLTKTGSVQELYAILLNVASKVGERYNVRIELSFPEKNSILDSDLYGTKNISFLVEKSRKQFHGATADEVRRQVELLFPGAIMEPSRFGYEGWRVQTEQGRIDILAGTLHIWRPITNEVVQLLDWLFANTYRK